MKRAAYFIDSIFGSPLMAIAIIASVLVFLASFVW